MKKSLGGGTPPMPAPVWIIGSYDEQGKANGMTASWAGIINSNPPAVYASIRKSRHTYDGILKHQAFTVCVPSSAHAREVDYMGIASGRDVDKLARAGLTPVRSELVEAPYIDEFPVAMECKLLQTVDLGSHTVFIGQVMDVKVEEAGLTNGQPDADKLDIFVWMDGYRKLGESLGQAFHIGRELM